MMWWNDGNAGAGDWIAMSFMMLVFVGALTAVAVWLLRTTRTSTNQTPAERAQSSDEILARRFARGEIDEDDYTRRREVLGNTGARTPTK
jgi:putative membrane protein